MTKPDGKLVLKMSLSLDGFVGGPNGELDWLFPHMGGDSAAWVVERIARPDVHIMGSRTFADMKAWWPYSTEPFAAPMNTIPKVVFARSGAADPTPAVIDAAKARGTGQRPADPALLQSWEESEVACGPLAGEIASLKRRFGLVMAHGGARFAQSLVAAGVVDEYWLVIAPVVLGRGLPLFSQLAKPLSFVCRDRRLFANGNMALELAPA